MGDISGPLFSFTTSLLYYCASLFGLRAKTLKRKKVEIFEQID